MSILGIELYKIFNRKRSYIGFIAVFMMVVLVLLGFYYEGAEMFGFITENLKESFVLQGNVLNGNMFAYLVLKSLWVHFPILVALVTGDLISGELQSGTLRLVISRPVSRSKLITAKFMAALIYVSSLVLFMAIVSIMLGYLFFGKGDLLVILNSVNIFDADDVLWRLIAAYLFAILSMGTIAALSLFLSALTDNSLAAILSTIAIVIILTFVALFNIPLLNMLKPFLFTSYTSSWLHFFEYGQSGLTIARDLFILLFHIIGFYLVTLIYFKRKDIVS